MLNAICPFRVELVIIQFNADDISGAGEGQASTLHLLEIEKSS